jgi:hypothetical protein
MAIKLTKAEAETLIEMLKRFVQQHCLGFPSKKGKLEFDVIGERKTDEFVVNIDRKGINADSCTYQGRIKSNNIVLLRLDINPTSIHINPSNHEKLVGSHLHIYSDEFEMSEAIPFDIEDKDLYELCFTFFEKFHIIEPPEILYQITLNT